MPMTYRILQPMWAPRPKPRGCKGWCVDHYPDAKRTVYWPFSKKDMKKCMKCEISVVTKHIFCKCCGTKLRYKPAQIHDHVSRYKRKGKRY